MFNPLIAAFCAVAAPLCPHKAPKPPPPPPAPAADAVAVTADVTAVTPPKGPAGQWVADGEAALTSLRRPVAAGTRARNVIVFIGDGMGLSTVTAARILDGQARQLKGGGEENRLSFETFPATALAKTYNVDLQVPESSGAMTAVMTGVKTRGASIGVDETLGRGQCDGAQDHRLATLVEQAKDAGLAAGVVTTARITLAVPASAYAHVSDRDWEVDSRMPKAALDAGCQDIAKQLVLFDHRGGLDVALGGGRLAFMRPDQADPQEPLRHGVRGDGDDLIARWRTRNGEGRYVTSVADLKASVAQGSGPILGLFAADDMDTIGDPTLAADRPTLTDMTLAAIAVLARKPKGYVLLVDAGGIDQAHHLGNAAGALERTIELSEAVAAADKAAGADTLIVVTADHSHTLTIGGYPRRGNPILGLATGADGAPLADARGRPFTTLAYANGPGGRSMASDASPPLTGQDATAAAYIQVAATPLDAETHSGEDVPIYARGPGAQWIHGAMEQNVLYWVMRAALALPAVPAP
jgi:alkaline phosphatase